MDFHPLNNVEFLLDPAETPEHMRVHHPVYRYEKSRMPIVNVFGFHDTRAILRDVERFSNTLTGDQQDKAATDPHNLLGMDPPGHRRMREVVSKVFTPGMVKSLTPVIREYANKIIDQVMETDEFDAVEDFGAQLAVHLICHLIGVPEADKGLIRKWTIEASELGFDLLWHESTNPEYEARIDESMSTMHDYFTEKIAERIKRPCKDILTEIAHSGLTPEETVSFSRLLLVAGNETTTNLINHTIRQLVTHPEQQRLLRSNPSLASTTIAETLRYAPPIRGTFRESKVDTTIHGVPINQREIIWAWFFSANRDPALCDHPQEYLVDRVPPNHLAFGHGIHTCLGISLAKMEALVMLETLLDRTQAMESTRDELEPIYSLLSNGYQHQWIRFKAA